MPARFCLSVLVLVISGMFFPASGQRSSKPGITLPSGDWNFTYSLDSPLGLKNPAAEIVANRGDAAQGLQVSVTRMVNRTDKTIANVRFGWFVYRTDHPDRILASGRSAL